MYKRLFFLISLLVCIGSMITAQEARNPFDLPDTDDIVLESPPETRVQSDNPFDLQPATTNINTSQIKEVKKPNGLNLPISSDASQGVRIGICLLLILPLALLLTLFRGVFNDFLVAAYRDRKFNQFFRRPNSMWVIPNVLLYIFFFISMSVFAYLALDYYGNNLQLDSLKSLAFLMIGIGGFFALKHAILFFLGDTFDVLNEAKRYSLLILTFNIILGVFLTPINLLLLIGPESIRGSVVITGFIFISLVLLLLLLRTLSLSNRLLLQHSLHFFMYLCAIEIAPLFIVVKLLT